MLSQRNSLNRQQQWVIHWLNNFLAAKTRTFLTLYFVLLGSVEAGTLPQFEEKISVATYAHIAEMGDVTPDEVSWTNADYLAEMDAKIEQYGFNAETGLAWSDSDQVGTSRSHLSLVAFDLSVDTPIDALLEVSAIQGVAWYYRDHDGQVRHHKDNYRQRLAARPIFDIRPVIPLRLEPGYTYRLFVATFVYSPGAVVSYDLWHAESFRANRTAFHLTEGMFFGFVATIAIISLLLAIAFRQIVYLFFAGFLASSAATIYASSGFALLFGLGENVYFAFPLIALFYGATAAFANLFSMYFLDMWHTNKRLYWIYFGLMICSVAVGVYPAYSGATIESFELVFLMTGIALLAGQAAHLYSLFHYFRGNRNVVYWWAGMSVYSGSMLFTMALAGEPIEIGNIPHLTIVLDAFLLMLLLLINFRSEQASRREAQHSSMENLRLARDLEKSRSTFVAAVGHDLRGPVQAISHFSESLKQSATESSQQTLEKIDQNLISISELLDSMINLSRVDWQASQPQIEAVAIRPILLELRSAFIGKAAEKNLELEIETTECAVMTDRVCLGQILRNLTDNAIKYTEQGYVRVRVIASESSVKIIVEDSGLGIPRDDLSNIFEEFYRGESANTETPGTGLGLSIVARLTRLLGIRITVNSEASRGSQFELELERINLPEQEVPLSDAALSGMAKTIAVVSSDLSVFSGVAELLEGWGAKVLVDDGMPRVAVDLIVLDEDAKRRLKLDDNIPLLMIEPGISPMKLRRLVHRQLNPSV